MIEFKIQESNDTLWLICNIFARLYHDFVKKRMLQVGSVFTITLCRTQIKQAAYLWPY